MSKMKQSSGLSSLAAAVAPSVEKVGPLGSTETIVTWLTAVTTPGGRKGLRQTRGSMMTRLAAVGQTGDPAPLLPTFTDEKGFHWARRSPKPLPFPVTGVPAHVRDWAVSTLADVEDHPSQSFVAATKNDDGIVTTPCIESSATRNVAALLLLAFDPIQPDEKIGEAFSLLGLTQPSGFDVSRGASLAGAVLFPKEA